MVSEIVIILASFPGKAKKWILWQRSKKKEFVGLQYTNLNRA